MSFGTVLQEESKAIWNCCLLPTVSTSLLLRPTVKGLHCSEVTVGGTCIGNAAEAGPRGCPGRKGRRTHVIGPRMPHRTRRGIWLGRNGSLARAAHVAAEHEHLKSPAPIARSKLPYWVAKLAASIFQGHANKSHHGHLGDSFVGEWANLGAGTVNSNLLNTYSEVLHAVWSPMGRPLRSVAERFLGCVIGDHVKTAIGTRIMTGSCPWEPAR